jgi:hypothetical protein
MHQLSLCPCDIQPRILYWTKILKINQKEWHSTTKTLNYVLTHRGKT